ncbi:MAG: PAS domain S-box protein [Myxococcota bacterium]|nr:PAS domain S-box protein [Myxococcota bacterium]
MPQQPTREELLEELATLRERVVLLEDGGAACDGCVLRVLRTGREQLIENWEQRVRHDPTVTEARSLSGPALRDHMPALLEELIGALERRKDARSTTAERLGRAVWHSPNAFAHAEERFEQGYTLTEVLRELSHLRVAMLDRCYAEGAHLGTAELRLVHVAIDEAMTVAATELERIAHADLLASEERYRLLVDGVRDYAIFMLDAEGRVASWNAGAEHVKGWSREEILGQPYAVFFAPEDRESGEPERVMAIAREHGRYQGRRRRIRQDGSMFLADVSLTAIRDAKGVLAGYAKITRDVTARVEAEVALAESEARLTAILSSAMDAIVTTDASQTIVLFNRSAEQTFGWAAADAIGQPIDRLFPERARAEHAERVHGFGESDVTSRALGRITGRRASGDEFAMDATWSEADLGDERYYTLVLRDITAQVAAEDARREAEVRLEAVLDNAGAVIFVKDLEGRYELVNRRFAEVFGLARDAVIGRTDEDLFAPEIAAAFRGHDREVMARGEPLETEEVAPHGDGLHTYVAVKFPLRDLDGEIRSVAGVATDITERVRAQAALAREVGLRELFVGVLAHDLRNPLNAISMTAAALLGRDLDAPTTKAIARVANGARRMTRMVEQLLDLTRARAGGIPVDRRPGDLADVYRSVVDELEATHPERTIEVSLEGDGRGEWDTVRLAQVVGNLLSNALAYSPPSTPVSLGLRDASADAVTIAVHNDNDGAAIAPELVQHLFDPFSRGARHPGHEGLGLGLFIVDQIARAHGGRVDIRSDESGTCFAVTLPRAARAAPPQP